jgi:hypothetical protein
MATTPLQRRFESDERLKTALCVLNSHPRIGPTAPGDGDVIQWFDAVCILGAGYVVNLTHADSRQVNLEVAAEPDVQAFKLSRFEQALSDQANAIFAHVIPKPTPTQTRIWKAVLNDVLMELGAQWGGRRVRVHKKSKSGATPLEKVQVELKKGTPLAEIPAKVNISRATLYRLLKTADPKKV